MERVLSLDLGERYVGVALLSGAREPHSLGSFKLESRHQLVDKLTELIEEYQVAKVLVGDMGLKQLPPIFQQALDELKKRSGVEIKRASEFLTSFQAKIELRQGVGSGAEPSVHSLAAVQLLREYLEKG